RPDHGKICENLPEVHITPDPLKIGSAGSRWFAVFQWSTGEENEEEREIGWLRRARRLGL
ncbi:hypothetical protein HAX54_045004, partial [Datura stramonium]|nr:hypothetical protein [Datura stramonium]